MSLEKVAIKNERPGTQLVIGEPTLENTLPEPTKVLAADKHEEHAPAKA